MDNPYDAPAGTDSAWLDQLVDLHVLTVHGDQDAAAAATRWLDHDTQAREVWNQVETTCERVRALEEPSA